MHIMFKCTRINSEIVGPQGYDVMI